MTPEHAHELGKRVSRELAARAADEHGEIHAGTPEALLHAVEASIQAEAGIICDNDIDRGAVAVGLRGAAEFWREFAFELEERAASIEVTR